jgi:hypothetical protein
VQEKDGVSRRFEEPVARDAGMELFNGLAHALGQVSLTPVQQHTSELRYRSWLSENGNLGGERGHWWGGEVRKRNICSKVLVKFGILINSEPPLFAIEIVHIIHIHPLRSHSHTQDCLTETATTTTLTYKGMQTHAGPPSLYKKGLGSSCQRSMMRGEEVISLEIG